MPGDKSPAPRGNDLAVPFLFVPAGQTPPEDWLWAHPGAIRIPATVTLRRDGTLAGIKIAQNEGDTIAAPSTARGFAPVPGQTEPETPALPLLSDVLRQFFIISHLKTFPFTEPPAEGPLSAVPLVDDQGNLVKAPDHHRRKGEPPRNIVVMRPQFMDPHFFVKKGIEDRKRDEEKIKKYEARGAPLDAHAYREINENLHNFNVGGPWDAQRIDGHFYRQYVEYATIAIGLYAAAYGIPESDILDIENQGAKLSAQIDFLLREDKYKDREMDNIYSYLPSDNTKWTDIGYKLYKSGGISP